MPPPPEPPPEPPELNDVRLDPPARPAASAELRALLARPLYTRLPPALERAIRALPEGAWPAEPAALGHALEALEPPLARGRAALDAPGCPPEEELRLGEEPTPASQVSHVNLLRLAKLETVRAAAAAAQPGAEPGASARSLAALHERLLELERRCSPSLIAAMVLLATVGFVEHGLVLLLAHPALAEEETRRVWDRLLAGEARPSPMPDAIRWEARFQRGLADAIERGDRTNEGGTPIVWPWYSRESTLALAEQLGRRAIWLAERPLTESGAWTRRFPEEEYLARLQRQPRALVLFRHNAIGKTLLALGPDLRRYVLRWHQARCLAIARRARLVRELRARGRAVPDAAALRSLDDPRTRVRFSGTELEVCGFPEAYTRGDRGLVAGARPRPLPPPPPLPASAPAAPPR